MRRIKQISVTKLFGLFDHVIPLNLQDNVTIIHGPNGMGKTILLKMIDGLSEDSLDIFYRVPFEVFRVDFEDQSHISIKRTLLTGSLPDHALSPDDKKRSEERRVGKEFRFRVSGCDG